LLLLQVLLVTFLAPAATSGAISLEREKQTLDLLTATPVSTLAIILGKLSSALAFVIVLILASIPLTAVVFVFGGVAPEDIVRGYAVLLVTALGFGSLGILLSSMTRRTQSATVLTYLGVLVLTVGTGFTWFFWDQMAGQRQVTGPIVRDLPAVGDGAGVGVAPDAIAPTASPGIPRPPEALLWLNPVVAAADVVCGTDVNPYSLACQLIGSVTGTVPGGGGVLLPGNQILPVKPGIDLRGGAVGGLEPAVDANGVGVVNAAVMPEEAFTSSSTRDSFWPHAAAAWLVMSVVLVLISVQLVSPTRRWRIFRRRSHPETQA
jgi:hypothetical protein